MTGEIDCGLIIRVWRMTFFISCTVTYIPAITVNIAQQGVFSDFFRCFYDKNTIFVLFIYPWGFLHSKSLPVITFSGVEAKN